MKQTAGYGAGLGLVGNGARDWLAQAPSPEEKVPRKQLGTTGADIPIILMGGSQKFDPRYDKVLHRAFQLGVDYIDTAQMYAQGQSQKTIAPFIKQIGDRKKLWITSKVKLVGSRATPEGFKANLDKCREDLETDYLDMFFLHMITEERLLGPDYIRMAEELKRAEKIRFFGFSCHDGNVAELHAGPGETQIGLGR